MPSKARDGGGDPWGSQGMEDGERWLQCRDEYRTIVVADGECATV